MARAPATPLNYSICLYEIPRPWASLWGKLNFTTLLFKESRAVQPRPAAFVLWQDLNWMTKHCGGVFYHSGKWTHYPLSLHQGTKETTSKWPRCPSPLWVLWGKGQVPGSFPASQTLPRYEPWKRAMRDSGTFIYLWGNALDLNLLLQLGDCFCLFFGLPFCFFPAVCREWLVMKLS